MNSTGKRAGRRAANSVTLEEQALDIARDFADNGMPVFTCRLKPDGDPILPNAWQKTPPDPSRVDRWKPGMGLCGVMGVLYDLLDVDPKNGGIASFKRMADDLGDDMPEVYWTVDTPSHGRHYYIAPLGIGSHDGFLPGLDLKGGRPDGTGRGFGFMPPTSRPSKHEKDRGTVRPYVPTMEWALPDGDPGCDRLRELIVQYKAEKRADAGLPATGRISHSILREQVIRAGKGGQRKALREYILELQKVCADRNLIIQLLLDLGITDFDTRSPWTERSFRNLLKRGVTADAAITEQTELAGIGEPHRIGGDSSISVDDVEEEEVSWLNDPFLPFGCIVIMDGDPGQGKSSITAGMVARAAVGKPALPFGNAMVSEPIHCGMIGAEDDIARVVRGRLRAAGYTDNRHIWTMGLKKDKRGKIEVLTFPHGTERVRSFIEDKSLRLLVIDPISSFIGEKINTHNEASVRAALAPLADIARETGCCIILVRHLNKDGSMKAMYRGGGSIAFSALARSGIITGVCPDGQYGLAHVKCSYAPKFKGVVRYSVNGWDENPGVAVVEWGEWDQELTADDILKGPGGRRGPEPDSQTAIREVLAPMFAEKDTWPQAECLKRLKESGASTRLATIDKVKNTMGIRSISIRDKETGRIVGSVWTTKKRTVSASLPGFPVPGI